MRPLLSAVLIALAWCGSARAAFTPLPTGNGFGLAVLSQSTGHVLHFYAHSYRYERPDPNDALGEGVETTDFVTDLAFDGTGAGSVAVGYRQESHIIASTRRGATVATFMPFGFPGAALVVVNEGSTARSLVPVWRHPVASRKIIQVAGARLLALTFQGVPETLLAIPLEPVAGGLQADGDRLDGGAGWAFVPVEAPGDIAGVVQAFEAWRGGLAAGALVERELRELEAWRVPPAVHFTSDAERRLWRQSEVVLRMAQVREPNRPGRWNHGMIVASLGEWFVPWVRDMAYATVALCRMGHRDEARAAVEAYFNARPVGKQQAAVRGQPYQVSTVRYFGDGSEEPFFTMEGSTNVELDNWGLVLWTLGEYVRRWGDDGWLTEPRAYRGSIYAGARDFIVAPLLANLDPCDGGAIVTADTSIWEERQKDKKHFAFSTAAAIAGLREFAALAGRVGDQRTQARVNAELDRLTRGFGAAYVATGRVRGTLEPGEKNDVDGAVLATINLGVVTDPAVIQATIASMDVLRVASGGWRRVRCQLTNPAIFEYWYEREEFVFVDLSLAEVDLRLGHVAEAQAISGRLVRKAAADNDLVPEMYVAVDCPLFHGALGDPTGAGPMVGYGAGAYVLYLLSRDAIAHAHPAVR